MCWEPAYILLILFSTTTDYFICRYVTSSPDKRKRRLGLSVNVFLNLGLLIVFKYLIFFQETFGHIAAWAGFEYKPATFSFLLPVGISFYTFQTLSYAIDVYRKTIEPERHFGKFAVFVSFFPQLVAGPIERAKDLLPQFHRSIYSLKADEVRSGLLLIGWGLFKKVVVADNVAGFVNAWYNTSEHQNGGTLLFATYLFAIQIYCDFSGYSDMAVGLAKLLGFKLTDNFRTPYFSSSISAFWNNWHISLSNWLRDYIYIPLGGNRKGKVRTTVNLMITMLLGGFWHGANWTFVVWGGYHGILLTIERWFEGWKTPSFLKVFRILIVFHLVCFGWIFFRSQTMEQAFGIIDSIAHLRWNDLYIAIAENFFTNAVVGCLILFLFDISGAFRQITHLREKPLILRNACYVLIVISILLMGSSAGDAFIYFQF